MSDNEEGKLDSTAWLATFGDLITLLMTFFVLLLSFSTINAEKFRAALDSIDVALGVSSKPKILNKDGVLELVNTQAVTKVMGGEETPSFLDPMDNVYEEVVEYLTQSRHAQFLQMNKTKQGFVISVDSGVFFEEGKAELKGGDHDVLDKLAELIRLFPNNLSVKGHIGRNFTPNEEFKSSMDLSIARAVSTCKYFLNQGISPERVGIAGYGSYRPVSSGTSAQGNVRDDRVELTIMNVRREE